MRDFCPKSFFFASHENVMKRPHNCGYMVARIVRMESADNRVNPKECTSSTGVVVAVVVIVVA